MARLPIPGQDAGHWGDILNDFLTQALRPDGTIKDNAITANNLAPNSVTNTALASNAVNATIIQDGSITETLLDGDLADKIDAAATPDWAAITNKPSVATLAGVETLTNKTLTGQSADYLNDASGNKTLALVSSGSDNYLQMSAKGAPANPSIGAQGSSANLGITFTPKGAGALQIYEGAGQTAAMLQADGTATNIDLNLTPKGTGIVKANNVQVADISSTQTLTNKTLTTPKIDKILDANGNTVVGTDYRADAVNYLVLGNQRTGNAPAVSVAGSDPNIALTLAPKGTGIINIYTSSGTTPMVAAQGADTNLDLKLAAKGTGVVRANGVPVATQTVTPPATATSTGVAGQIAYDASYFYQCVATNTWKRSALSSW